MTIFLISRPYRIFTWQTQSRFAKCLKLANMKSGSDDEPAHKSRKLVSTQNRDCTEEVSLKGAFKRTDSTYRNWIGKNKQFQPEANRYHLYISYACPWASRCLAVLYMKGLEDVIGLSITHPTWQRSRPGDNTDLHRGWVFKDPDDPPLTQTEGYGSFDGVGSIPDTVNGFSVVRDIYEACNDKAGKYTVPVLWDKKTKTIVSNESSDIVLMFNGEFNEWAKDSSLDLAPRRLERAMADVNAWVYPHINDGVYRCGFAKSQPAYDEAVQNLYEALDKAEELLSAQRYLCGNHLTLSDIRLFCTLVRFDEVYVVYFKCNVRCIREYPNLFNYVRDIYQTRGVARSVNMKHIKTHYFSSHPALNAYAVVPRGPDVDFNAKHDRHRFD